MQPIQFLNCYLFYSTFFFLDSLRTYNLDLKNYAVAEDFKNNIVADLRLRTSKTTKLRNSRITKLRLRNSRILKRRCGSAVAD